MKETIIIFKAGTATNYRESKASAAKISRIRDAVKQNTLKKVRLSQQRTLGRPRLVKSATL